MGKEINFEHKLSIFPKVKNMSSTRLQKPTFCKITDIKAGRHCYNVYCRITELNASEITKFNGEVIRIADGVVGDETGVANFRLVGDNVDKVKTNMVVSIRNGRSEVVDEHIRLEVDKFGKVQEEAAVTIGEVKSSENISSYAYVKK